MMKRIYKKKKRKAVKEQAMEQFRETRAKIEKDHPELLERMRAEIKKAETVQKKPKKPVVKKAPAQCEAEDGYIHIDRAKNVETVLRFLALNPENDALKKEIKSFLQ